MSKYFAVWRPRKMETIATTANVSVVFIPEPNDTSEKSTKREVSLIFCSIAFHNALKSSDSLGVRESLKQAFRRSVSASEEKKVMSRHMNERAAPKQLTRCAVSESKKVFASKFAAKYDPVTPNMMVETTFLIQICSAIFYLVEDCSYSSFFLMLVYL